jgi:serine/threonine-protein kinase
MHPKDKNPPPRESMEEEDTNPSGSASGNSLSVDVDMNASDSSSGLRLTGAEVVSERLESDALLDAMHDPRLGETLVGRYRLDKLVGKGGMGRVYRATQFPLNRPVAVKILNPEFQQKDPQFVRRFFLEAASAARLTHPNTITVFDYGEAESGELFIAMEYLKGRPLSKVITSDGPFPAERTLHIAMQICRALREAHSKGIIHRDLKPGNILLLEEGDDADFVKVLDFGLVKLFTPLDLGRSQSSVEPLTPGPVQEGDLTKAGMFLGSPKYMSPEQIQAIPLDPRTDIYSLGVLMYQMAAGKPPFAGDTSVEVIYKHVNHPVPSISETSPGVIVPHELEAAIMKCLAKKREDRFDSMAELLVRLKDVRRLLTGVSSASESGMGLRLRGPDVSVSGPGQIEDLSLSGSASLRPQTHPRVRASSVPMEAAFVDPSVHEDGNPTNSFMQQARLVQSPTARLSRLAPALAGTALVLVLGVLAYVMSRPAPSTTPSAPPPIQEEPHDLKARVRFNSTPPGAEVFQDGVSLGHTPLTVNLPRAQPGEPPEQFILKLAGHQDEIHEAALDSATIDISVRMRPRPKDEPGSEDYKENPY